jgi:hypothetical protein
MGTTLASQHPLFGRTDDWLVRSRNRGGANAEVCTGDRRRERQDDLGDAIEEVLTTPSGAIWVGYFDEAMSGGDQPTDHGQAPYRGAHALLIDGSFGALVGGYGPEYDLVGPFHIAAQRVDPVGEPLRLVLPDGLEVRGCRFFCRGPELHAVIGDGWYRADLDQLTRT